MSELIELSQQGAVLRITLQRADKKNALNRSMYLQLTSALRQAEADSAIRAVLITGSGDSFSSGNDIADFVAMADSPEGSADGTVGAQQCYWRVGPILKGMRLP